MKKTRDPMDDQHASVVPPPVHDELPDEGRVLPPSLQRFEFNWTTMHSIVAGRSAVDMAEIRIQDAVEAYRFLRRYGYDLRKRHHRELTSHIQREALSFVRSILLRDTPGVDVPEDIAALDPVQLLMLAGQRPTEHAAKLRQAWACSLLRVMHAYSHSVNYFHKHYYREVREQILQRFVNMVHTRPDGSRVLRGHSLDVPVVRLDLKEAKPQHSIVLKLLHKWESVTTDVFDHIGVRIIVPRPVHALLAVRALRERHAFVYPNIKPTRSRNTLIDLQALDEHVKAVLTAYRRGDIEEAEAYEQIETFQHLPVDASGDPTQWNLHTSPRYNAIQFTCRQTIRLRNRVHERLSDAATAARRLLEGDKLEQLLRILDPDGIERETRFYFHYEVQILDIASYDEAVRGRASYDEYKRRQIEAARNRTLGRVLRLLEGEP